MHRQVGWSSQVAKGQTCHSALEAAPGAQRTQKAVPLQGIAENSSGGLRESWLRPTLWELLPENQVSGEDRLAEGISDMGA